MSPGADRGKPEATSLLGLPLYARDALAGKDLLQLERRLAGARAAAEGAPEDSGKLLELARGLAELSRYREAISVYTQGLRRWPDDSRFFEQRGRRRINLRQFAAARKDLEQARKLAPGPDTLLYLGLTHYLERDYPEALKLFRRSLRALGAAEGSGTGSLKRVRRLDWIFMTLLRLGRHEEARRLLAPTSAFVPLDDTMASFLCCFRFYLGEQEESVTREQISQLHRWGNSRMYGLGNWHQCRGDMQQAAACYAAVLNTTNWPSFTFLAAELELAAGL